MTKFLTAIAILVSLPLSASFAQAQNEGSKQSNLVAQCNSLATDSGFFVEIMRSKDNEYTGTVEQQGWSPTLIAQGVLKIEKIAGTNGVNCGLTFKWDKGTQIKSEADAFLDNISVSIMPGRKVDQLFIDGKKVLPGADLKCQVSQDLARELSTCSL